MLIGIRRYMYTIMQSSYKNIIEYLKHKRSTKSIQKEPESIVMPSIEESNLKRTPRPQPMVLLSPTMPPLFKPLVPLVKRQLRLCQWLSTIPFEWEEGPGVGSGSLKLIQSQKQLVLCQAQLGIHVIYTLLMTGYFLSPENLRVTKNSTRMIG